MKMVLYADISCVVGYNTSLSLTLKYILILVHQSVTGRIGSKWFHVTTVRYHILSYSLGYVSISVYVVVSLFNFVIYVFLLLCLCILIVCLCIFIVIVLYFPDCWQEVSITGRSCEPAISAQVSLLVSLCLSISEC
jgi:hypothetical protein